LKLTFISEYNPLATSNASANRDLSLLEGLVHKGWKVEILVYGGYRSKTEKQKFFKSGEISRLKYTYLHLKTYDTLWARRYFEYIGRRLTWINIKRKLTNYLRQNSGGVLWIKLKLPLLKFLVKKRQNFASWIYFTEQSEFLDIYSVHSTNPLQQAAGQNLQSFFENVFLQHLDGMALMTKTLLDHYQAFKEPSTEMIHLPMTVDLGRFSIPPVRLTEFEPPYIVFVGVMNNIKDGVDILIEAFSKIADDFPEYTLYLIGPWQPDTPGHLKQIEDLGLIDRVFWMKTYPRDTIPSIISKADLLVLPRPDSKQAQGGFPTKLGEYLASGVPVCATTVGEIPDYLEDGKSVFFAEPGSVESFSNAMAKALSNPEKAANVGAAGRKVAERHFNSTIQAEKLHSFLKMLLKEKEIT
jgi:glycosyltransferase involved in cell wall biosynthesis